MLSKCCKVAMDVESGGCVAYYLCRKCGKATDPLVLNLVDDRHNDRYTDQNESTQGINDG